MTANQISFARAKEEARHNRVSERHEHYDTRTRRQQAEAQISQADTARKQLGINWWSAQETRRAAMAKEAETYRHNYQQEQLDSYRYMTAAAAAQDQARAALRQAATAERSATTQESALAETIRRNKALEVLQQSELAETRRYHTASVGLGYSQLHETARSHQAQEGLQLSSLAESIRHNQEQEKVATSQALSQSRSAEAAVTRASADMAKSSAAVRQADAAESQAKSARIRAITDAVDVGSGIAKDIVGTLGGFFR